jgi:hypothetical protein
MRCGANCASAGLSCWVPTTLGSTDDLFLKDSNLMRAWLEPWSDARASDRSPVHDPVLSPLWLTEPVQGGSVEWCFHPSSPKTPHARAPGRCPSHDLIRSLPGWISEPAASSTASGPGHKYFTRRRHETGDFPCSVFSSKHNRRYLSCRNTTIDGSSVRRPCSYCATVSGTCCLIAGAGRQDDSNFYVFAGPIPRDLPGPTSMEINVSSC